MVWKHLTFRLMEIVLKRIAKKNLYIGRLYLLGVPNFEGMVVDSRIWLHQLINVMEAARDRGESIWITII